MESSLQDECLKSSKLIWKFITCELFCSRKKRANHYFQKCICHPLNWSHDCRRCRHCAIISVWWVNTFLFVCLVYLSISFLFFFNFNFFFSRIKICIHSWKHVFNGKSRKLFAHNLLKLLLLRRRNVNVFPTNIWAKQGF